MKEEQTVITKSKIRRCIKETAKEMIQHARFLDLSKNDRWFLQYLASINPNSNKNESFEDFKFRIKELAKFSGQNRWSKIVTEIH